MIRRLLLLVLVLAIIGTGVLVWAVGVPWAGYANEVFIDIPPGTGTRSMARMLADAGVVRDEWQFVVARAVRPGATLQAGEYRFDSPLSPWQVFDKIARGDVFYHILRVPEGANIFEIGNELERMGLMKAQTFLEVARDPSMIRDIAPDAPSLEGFLFPSTYRITRRTTAQQICREMTNQFRKAWTQLGGPADNVNALVTLASLVEKETAVPEERTTVASVYKNRIDLGMRLDCDPTTLYAALLEGRYRGQTIYKSDLESPHPYNTYRNRGLPPGAIANPGVESLKAALNPANTNYLFFVAKGDGTGAHVFTETLTEHNAAVRDYRNAIAR